MREGPAPSRTRCFFLWPEHAEAFDVFQALQTQWRVGGVGSRTGLDYAAVLAYLRETHPGPRAQRQRLFGELQLLELAALSAWAERQQRESARPRR